MMIRIVLILFLITQYLGAQQLSCSAFVVNSNKNYVGKNLDWSLGNGIIIFNPANEKKSSVTSSKKWVSKFRSLTFNHLGKNMPLGGMNECGLVIEELSSWSVKYPHKDSTSTLNEFEWIQYNLDNNKNVTELIENIELLGIEKFAFGIHH